MAEVQNWQKVDASNTDLWPENMPFSGVNNAGRAMQGLIARWYADTDASLTAGGSSNAFTATSNRTIAALFNNLTMAFTANFSITGPATLNLNGTGAKTIKRFNGSDLAAGDIISGQPLVVVYKSSPDVWFMMTAPAALVTSMFVDMSENASPGDPAADVARLYAVDDGTGKTVVRYRDSGALVFAVDRLVQRAYAETTANTALTATVPFDDTIPQITEGTEVLTVSITPKSTLNRIRIRFVGWGGYSIANAHVIAALFMDAVPDALQAVMFANSTAGSPGGINLVMDFEHAPATLSAITYRIRVGPSSADPGTFRLNGTTSARLLGGAARATLIVEELRP